VHVDRQRFLWLAGAIAGGCGGTSGCGGQSGAPEPAPPVVIATADAIPELPEVVDSPRSEPEGPGASEEAGAITLPLAGEDGSCRAIGVARASGAGCDDSKGTPASCRSVKLAGGCSSFPFICDQCESYKKSFKPRVAERAVACVIAQNQAQLGDGCATYACGDEALKSACLDPSADQPCQQIASACRTTVDECRGLLSGMNANGRASVAGCASRGCPYGIWSCIEGLQ
jgi:hypothetical protein